MNPAEPPRVALALLRRFVPDNEPLAGDLIERFAVKRSRWWFWREVFLAIAIRSVQPRDDAARPLGLSDAPPVPRSEPAARRINLTASPLPGIGGLGLVALGALVAMARPDAWLMFLPAIVGGMLIGIVMVLVRRNRPLHEPTVDWRVTIH